MRVMSVMAAALLIGYAAAGAAAEPENPPRPEAGQTVKTPTGSEPGGQTTAPTHPPKRKASSDSAGAEPQCD